MINCEHFIYGQFNGVGYKLIMSPNVHAVISDGGLTKLCHLGGGLKKEAFLRTWVPEEGILAFSYLRPTKDEFDRSGIWNHTIIVPMHDFLETIVSQIMPTFEPHFIKQMVQYPKRLEPLHIP